ncbi:MAG TPA: cytochrome d ubiquinol oxidase subunit II [Baekduia sp.]
MLLDEIPIILILVGLAAYIVLAGADFGAGLWMLLARPGRADAHATRDHARHAMGPVWEANHVWLIFILVTCWTAYPVAFGSIFSTLSIPLFAAALGIIMRGAAYALRGQLDGTPQRRHVEMMFAFSSILTPFALGTVIGAIASGRVPVGNAQGDRWTSWTGPTSLLIGVLAVAAGAFLAAVYLSADARRLRERTLELDFRERALVSGVVAGGLALAGLLVLHDDARALWDGLTSGWGLVMVALSAVCGLTSLTLVWRSRFEPARYVSALAVAAIVAGWGIAQEPQFLPGLTIEQAAAGHTTLVAVVIAAGIGAIVLIPSLVFLFRLFLHGHLDAHGTPDTHEFELPRGDTRADPRRLEGFAAATLVVGVGATAFVDPAWGRVVGIACLIAGALSLFGLATAGLGEDA